MATGRMAADSWSLGTEFFDSLVHHSLHSLASYSSGWTAGTDRGSEVVYVFCLASSDEGKAKPGICRLQLTSAFTNELLYRA